MSWNWMDQDSVRLVYRIRYIHSYLRLSWEQFAMLQNWISWDKIAILQICGNWNWQKENVLPSFFSLALVATYATKGDLNCHRAINPITSDTKSDFGERPVWTPLRGAQYLHNSCWSRLGLCNRHWFEIEFDSDLKVRMIEFDSYLRVRIWSWTFHRAVRKIRTFDFSNILDALTHCTKPLAESPILARHEWRSLLFLIVKTNLGILHRTSLRKWF